MRVVLCVALAGSVLVFVRSAVAADAPGTAGDGPCVDVQVGGERAPTLDCINRRLRLQVEQKRAALPLAAPIDSHSPSTTVGTANAAAAAQMMGDAFGKSATPQRPKPVFVPPVPVPNARH